MIDALVSRGIPPTEDMIHTAADTCDFDFFTKYTFTTSDPRVLYPWKKKYLGHRRLREEDWYDEYPDMMQIVATKFPKTLDGVMRIAITRRVPIRLCYGYWITVLLHTQKWLENICAAVINTT